MPTLHALAVITRDVAELALYALAAILFAGILGYIVHSAGRYVLARLLDRIGPRCRVCTRAWRLGSRVCPDCMPIEHDIRRWYAQFRVDGASAKLRPMTPEQLKQLRQRIFSDDLGN